MPSGSASRVPRRVGSAGTAATDTARLASLPRKLLSRNRSHERLRPSHHRVTVPTTYLWGRDDPALGREAAEAGGAHVASDYRFVELDAGHWIPETAPDAVVDAVRRRVAG